MENRKALYATSGLKSGFITYDNSVKENYYSSEERKERINTATDTLIFFTNVAYKISLCFCAIMLIFMLIAGVYTIAVYLGQRKPVEGWTPLMGLMSAGFLGIFLVLAVIIKYLDVALKLLFQKQQYMVASIEKNQ